MTNFVLCIWNDECEFCTFYSVTKSHLEEEDSLCETDKFFIRFENPTNEYFDAAGQLLIILLESIGNKYGAIDDFFDRNKNCATALPPKPKKSPKEIAILGSQFPLRLYCHRITPHIVILFNGGIKDARTDQLCPDLSLKFIEAQQFVDLIERAIRNKEIIVSKNGRYLNDQSGSQDIII